MRFEALATDFDGTLAADGVVAASTLTALEQLRGSGRRAFLVTGREVPDLLRVFPRADLFDVIVAENGALLYYPATGRFKALAKPPPTQFVEALRRRSVHPLAVGRVIVATIQSYTAVVAEVIKELGLALELILNRDSVMVLPEGVNKGAGLAAALAEFGLTPSQTVGVGDAENDHTFLRLSGFSVAVRNALPGLKGMTDYVTREANGRGVVELIDMLLSNDLPARRR